MPKAKNTEAELLKCLGFGESLLRTENDGMSSLSGEESTLYDQVTGQDSEGERLSDKWLSDLRKAYTSEEAFPKFQDMMHRSRLPLSLTKIAADA